MMEGLMDVEAENVDAPPPSTDATQAAMHDRLRDDSDRVLRNAALSIGMPTLSPRTNTTPSPRTAPAESTPVVQARSLRCVPPPSILLECVLSLHRLVRKFGKEMTAVYEPVIGLLTVILTLPPCAPELKEGASVRKELLGVVREFTEHVGGGGYKGVGLEVPAIIQELFLETFPRTLPRAMCGECLEKVVGEFMSDCMPSKTSWLVNLGGLLRRIFVRDETNAYVHSVRIRVIVLEKVFVASGGPYWGAVCVPSWIGEMIEKTLLPFVREVLGRSQHTPQPMEARDCLLKGHAAKPESEESDMPVYLTILSILSNVLAHTTTSAPHRSAIITVVHSTLGTEGGRFPVEFQIKAIETLGAALTMPFKTLPATHASIIQISTVLCGVCVGMAGGEEWGVVLEVLGRLCRIRGSREGHCVYLENEARGAGGDKTGAVSPLDDLNGAVPLTAPFIFVGKEPAKNAVTDGKMGPWMSNLGGGRYGTARYGTTFTLQPIFSVVGTCLSAIKGAPSVDSVRGRIVRLCLMTQYDLMVSGKSLEGIAPRDVVASVLQPEWTEISVLRAKVVSALAGYLGVTGKAAVSDYRSVAKLLCYFIESTTDIGVRKEAAKGLTALIIQSGKREHKPNEECPHKDWLEKITTCVVTQVEALQKESEELEKRDFNLRRSGDTSSDDDDDMEVFARSNAPPFKQPKSKSPHQPAAADPIVPLLSVLTDLFSSPTHSPSVSLRLRSLQVSRRGAGEGERTRARAKHRERPASEYVPERRIGSSPIADRAASPLFTHCPFIQLTPFRPPAAVPPHLQDAQLVRRSARESSAAARSGDCNGGECAQEDGE